MHLYFYIGYHYIHQLNFENILYIFVNLNDQENPDYYIATGQEAKEKVKQYATRGIIDLSTLKSDIFLNRWDKLELVDKTLKQKK